MLSNAQLLHQEKSQLDFSPEEGAVRSERLRKKISSWTLTAVISILYVQ
jgi:hypothetical protein